MDLAHHIVDIAREQERREANEGSVIVEVVHNLFDTHMCSQWFRLSCCPKGGVSIRYRTADMHFESLKEFNRIAADLILQAILADALEHAGTNIYTDMDFIVINVIKRKQRLSSTQIFFKEELNEFDLNDWEEWVFKNLQARRLRNAFKRQCAFAWKAL